MRPMDGEFSVMSVSFKQNINTNATISQNHTICIIIIIMQNTIMQTQCADYHILQLINIPFTWWLVSSSDIVAALTPIYTSHIREGARVYTM